MKVNIWYSVSVRREPFDKMDIGLGSYVEA